MLTVFQFLLLLIQSVFEFLAIYLSATSTTLTHFKSTYYNAFDKPKTPVQLIQKLNTQIKANS